MSRIAPKGKEKQKAPSCCDRMNDGRKAFDILMEAQNYWNQMERFRRERERNKRYTYGDQWGDMVVVNCERMSEEEYIQKQGKVALKNNLIRRMVKNVIGVYRSQEKEPSCFARDRDEQRASETMSTVLQYNLQLNRMDEINARTMEEFLISALAVHRISYGWRNGRVDNWIDYVQPNNFFIDNNMRDFRGWDCTCVGEVHDVSFGQLCEQFAKSDADVERLKQIYHWSHDRQYMVSYVGYFGYSKLGNYDFLFTDDPNRCRVVEVWRKEQVPRYRCHDYQNGEIFRIDLKDYDEEVTKANQERQQIGLAAGMAKEDIPYVEAEWFMDDTWHFYYLSPFGDILMDGETPYEHGSHPYVFKAFPFIDGEIHSFVADIIDQQRYVNRLITLYDWIMRASAKGVLLVPRDCLGESSVEDFADSWTEFNGVIVYEPSKSGNVPTQVAQNSTNIGIAELLNIQLQFFEDISGVNGALQGKAGYAGESAAHFNAQTQNATMSLLDMLSSFDNFVKEEAYKTVKNIQQFYDQKRIINISGKSGGQIVYEPQKIRDVEYDISIAESTTTPTYRQLGNDILMQLYQSQAINVKQLLEFGNFPFADELLQSIQANEEQMVQGQQMQGIDPNVAAQVQQQANPQAVAQLQQALERPQAV